MKFTNYNYKTIFIIEPIIVYKKQKLFLRKTVEQSFRSYQLRCSQIINANNESLVACFC